MKRYRPGDIVRWRGLTCRVLSSEDGGCRILPPIGAREELVPVEELLPGPPGMRMTRLGDVTKHGRDEAGHMKPACAEGGDAKCQPE